MIQRGRKRKRRKYTLQALWIFAAVIASIGLLLGYKLGFSDGKNEEGTIVNAAGQPDGLIKDNLLALTPILQASVTPEPTVTPTPTPEPQGPYQVYNPSEGEESNITPIPSTGEEVTEAEETVQETQKMIALTFDDGPYPPVTDRILQTLRDNDSHATFFVMGNRAETYSDTIAQAFADGNQIGNHTYSHKDLTKLSADQIIYEVQYSNDMINQSAEVGDAYLRPPYGAKSETVKSTVGVPMICWNVDTLDWKTKDADAIYKEIMGTVKDGDILLMHDLYPSTADAMEKVIPELIRQGYKLVTVKELLESRGVTPEAGSVYYSARQ